MTKNNRTYLEEKEQDFFKEKEDMNKIKRKIYEDDKTVIPTEYKKCEKCDLMIPVFLSHHHICGWNSDLKEYYEIRKNEKLNKGRPVIIFEPSEIIRNPEIEEQYKNSHRRGKYGVCYMCRKEFLRRYSERFCMECRNNFSFFDTKIPNEMIINGGILIGRHWRELKEVEDLKCPKCSTPKFIFRNTGFVTESSSGRLQADSFKKCFKGLWGCGFRLLDFKTAEQMYVCVNCKYKFGGFSMKPILYHKQRENPGVLLIGYDRFEKVSKEIKDMIFEEAEVGTPIRKITKIINREFKLNFHYNTIHRIIRMSKVNMRNKNTFESRNKILQNFNKIKGQKMSKSKLTLALGYKPDSKSERWFLLKQKIATLVKHSSYPAEYRFEIIDYVGESFKIIEKEEYQ